MELKVTPWDKEEPPTEADLAEQLGEQELRVYHWSSPPEGMFAGHTHGYHKVLFILEGSIEFEFPTRHQSIRLKAGDGLIFRPVCAIVPRWVWKVCSVWKLIYINLAAARSL